MRRHASRFAAAVLMVPLLSVGVAGANPGGGAPGQSPPTNLSLPTISGTAQVGQTLVGNPGTWSGPNPSYAYQWQRCGATCNPIAGATAATYSPVSADVG